jgi:hypothetical protein
MQNNPEQLIVAIIVGLLALAFGLCWGFGVFG